MVLLNHVFVEIKVFLPGLADIDQPSVDDTLLVAVALPKLMVKTLVKYLCLLCTNSFVKIKGKWKGFICQ